MIFEDPIRTVSLELPAGWTYSRFDSTLTDFYFSRWDDPGEMIGVHVRPALVPGEEPDEKWIEQIRADIADKAVLADIPGAGSRAVAAEFNSGNGRAQRVAFIRGPRVELVIEQRSAASASGSLWAPLEQAVKTISSVLNLETPRESGPDEFNQHIEKANDAYALQDFPAVVEALEKALKIGTSAWLCSLAPPVNSPDLHAAARVGQVMRDLSGFNEDPGIQRDAESVLRRVLRTIDTMGASSEDAQKIRNELATALDTLVSEMLEGTQEKEAGNLSPVVAMRERGLRLAQAATRSFDDREFSAAHQFSRLSADELLSLMSFLRRYQSQDIPQEIAAHLASQGISDPADQKRALQMAREAVLFPPLILSLQIQYCCSLELGAPDFADAAEVLLPAARQLQEGNAGDIGIELNLALAWMIAAGALAIKEGKIDASQARQFLDSAAGLLASVNAAQGFNDGWVRNHGIYFEKTLEAIDRRLALSEEPETLRGIRSRLEELSVEFGKKATPGAA